MEALSGSNLALAGRRALVTGGSGSVGAAIVKRLTAAGAAVTFTYLDNDPVANNLSVEAGAAALRLDLSSVEAVQAVDLGRVDILVNCAGVNIASDRVADISHSDWELTLLVNLTAPFLLAGKVIPGMIERQWGRIVSVGSIYSIRGSTNNGPYNASKHGLLGLSRTIALEYAGERITANDVLPGAIESNLMNRIARAKGGSSAEVAEAYLQGVRDASPDGRMATPAEVAAVVEFLCREESSHINGAAITVDGGSVA